MHEVIKNKLYRGEGFGDRSGIVGELEAARGGRQDRAEGWAGLHRADHPKGKGKVGDSKAEGAGLLSSIGALPEAGPIDGQPHRGAARGDLPGPVLWDLQHA